MRTYLQAKSKEGKEQSLADIERIRAAMAQKVLGWDKDSVHGLTVALIALVTAFIEVGGPWAGFTLWPSRQQEHPGKVPKTHPLEQRFSETFRKPSAMR